MASGDTITEFQQLALARETSSQPKPTTETPLAILALPLSTRVIPKAVFLIVSLMAMPCLNFLACWRHLVLKPQRWWTSAHRHRRHHKGIIFYRIGKTACLPGPIGSPDALMTRLHVLTAVISCLGRSDIDWRADKIRLCKARGIELMRISSLW